jgi:glycine dehydrogenase subunit 1
MFIPHTDSDREAMLKVVGVASVEDLFRDVPEKYRFPELDLPSALSEMEARTELQTIAAANDTADDLACFLGAGAYHHYVPAAVDSILQRGEFYTAYTPYQPEVSQGTLQSIFEYQSLVVALTGMEVSNASHYDGATAVAEAVNMAYANFRGKRTRVVLSSALHPQYRAVVRTYMEGTPITVTGDESPQKTPDALLPHLDLNTALVVVQYPDFFGRVFDYTRLADAAHAVGALLAISVNPIALGLLKTPADMGADIVTGEGQPLGIPLSYGGPYLGLFATRQEYVRKMAGRLVGETVDFRSGERAYTLTLTAREQHIRRDKASSNICTNQGLLVLASAVYMSLLGKHGLRQVAELCYHKAHYAADQITKLRGFTRAFGDPFFNEFAVQCPAPVQDINGQLLEHGILGGYDLGQDYPELEDTMLVAVTEMNTRDEIDGLVEVLSEVAHG